MKRTYMLTINIAFAIAVGTISFALVRLAYLITFYKFNELTYCILFSIALVIFSNISLPYIKSWTPQKISLYGMLSGFVIGSLCSAASEIAKPDGIEILINTSSKLGLLSPEFLLSLLIPPTISGAWFVAAVFLVMFTKQFGRRLAVS